MSTLWIAALAGLVLVCMVLGVVAWLIWHRVDLEERTLIKRVTSLRLRNKLHLAVALAREPRIPLAVRAIPPALVLYLATPIDLIPDFIPVIGYLDDLLVVVIGVGILLRFTPRYVLEEHIARLESAERNR
jgi:uncharacterized membrane protein YkvA (DUF1232 family)